MASTPHLMTFAEFAVLPESHGLRQELHHGELVTLPPPKRKHFFIQRKLRMLLEPFAGQGGVVEKEVGFRPYPEHEFWIADVAYLSAERSKQSDAEDNFVGAPELVIEVLSPSNTAAEIQDKQQICLANGSLEFWVVDPKRHSIKVTGKDGHTRTYSSGHQIPLTILRAEATLNVDAVFQS
jgi:Uma2 family endonuclease